MRPSELPAAPMCATPATSVENTSGPMIILISRRNMSVASEKYPARVFSVAGSVTEALTP